MKIRQLATLLLGVLMTGLVSCEYVTIVPEDVIIPVTPVDFTTEIEPIFTQLGCTQCHPALHQPDFAAGKAYASLMSNHLVDTLNPAASILMQKIDAGHNSAVNMTATQKALILKWITEGAKGVIIPVSFKNEVEPIFTQANCVSCHGGAQKPDLRKDKAYASLTTNNLVVAENAAGSKLIQYINSGHQTSTTITADNKALIVKWITEGAKNN